MVYKKAGPFGAQSFDCCSWQCPDSRLSVVYQKAGPGDADSCSEASCMLPGTENFVTPAHVITFLQQLTTFFLLADPQEGLTVKKDPLTAHVVTLPPSSVFLCLESLFHTVNR